MSILSTRRKTPFSGQDAAPAGRATTAQIQRQIISERLSAVFKGALLGGGIEAVGSISLLVIMRDHLREFGPELWLAALWSILSLRALLYLRLRRAPAARPRSLWWIALLCATLAASKFIFACAYAIVEPDPTSAVQLQVMLIDVMVALAVTGFLAGHLVAVCLYFFPGMLVTVYFAAHEQTLFHQIVTSFVIPLALIIIAVAGWGNRLLSNSRRLRVELAYARDAAQAADRSKSLFIANMSHELRTPLNAIIGFSEMLKNQMLGPLGDLRYREYAESIHQSGDYLLSIINDILDLSRIESGRATLRITTVELPHLARSAIRMVAEAAAEAGVKITLRIPDGAPAITADERMVKQMMLNLLSNAVKFTPAGGDIELAVRRNDADELGLIVKDTGIGVDPRDLPTVMEAFGQVETPLNRRHRGTGLGLPLVKSMADQHGARLSFTSRPNEGTEAAIWFPKSRIVTAPAPAPKATLHAPPSPTAR